LAIATSTARWSGGRVVAVVGGSGRQGGGPAVDGLVDLGAGLLDGGGHLHQAVLDGLELQDRPAEGFALAGVLGGAGGLRVGGGNGHDRGQQPVPGTFPGQQRVGPTNRPEHRIRAEGHVVERDRGDVGPTQAQRVDLLRHPDAGQGRIDEEQRPALRGVGGHDQQVRARAVGDPRLGAGQHPAILVAPSRGRQRRVVCAGTVVRRVLIRPGDR
jgi:hypothetical protein